MLALLAFFLFKTSPRCPLEQLPQTRPSGDRRRLRGHHHPSRAMSSVVALGRHQHLPFSGLQSRGGGRAQCHLLVVGEKNMSRVCQQRVGIPGGPPQLELLGFADVPGLQGLNPGRDPPSECKGLGRPEPLCPYLHTRTPRVSSTNIARADSVCGR